MAEGMIEVTGLCVDLGGKAILADVEFSVARGAFAVVVGPNGSGKTTLIRSLYRSVEPSRGAVLLDGTPVSAMDRRSIARTMAVLRQEPDLEFDFLVQELVLMGRSPHKGLFDPDSAEDRRTVSEAMDLTDVASLKSRRFSTLSGGEKQRVLLARALAQKPKILLLDEPTNHLDVRHQLDVLHRVRALGLTVVAALHDLNLADTFATQVLVLHAGRLAAEGTPEETLTAERIRETFGVGARRVHYDDRSVIAFERLE